MDGSTSVAEVPHLGEVRVAVPPSHRVLARQLLLRLAPPTHEDTAGTSLASIERMVTEIVDTLDQDRDTADPPAGSVPLPVLALNLVNAHLNPFLVEWRSRYRSWHKSHPDLPESEWGALPAFTADLERLREVINGFATAFAHAAGYSPDDIAMIGLNRPE